MSVCFIMTKLVLRRILKIINFILLIVCIFNSCNVIYSLVYPQLPTIRIYETNLKDIEFPLSFRICLNDINDNTKRYRTVGYRNDYSFFGGISMFNESVVGWGGHNKNGDTIGTTDRKKCSKNYLIHLF